MVASSTAPFSRVNELIRFGLAAGATTSGLQLLTYAVLGGVVSGWSYPLGVLLGVPVLVLLMLIAGSPLLLAPAWGQAMATVGCATVALSYSLGAVYHSSVGRLPGFATAKLALSSPDVAQGMATPSMWGLLVVSVVAPAVVGHAARRQLRWQPVASKRALLGSGVQLVLLTSGVLFATAGSGGQAYYGAIGTPLHVARSALAVPPLTPAQATASPSSPGATPKTTHFVRPQGLLDYLAPERPEPIADRRYPLCRQEPNAVAGVTRSAILIILEGIDNRVLNAELQGQALAPALQKIAAENLTFLNFFAAGDRSSQALTSITAGLPASTHRRILTHAPLLELRGFPELLRDGGASTAYFHGSDLSFEQQRTYLQRVGYTELKEPRLLDGRQVGWGLPDDRMFAELTAWIDSTNKQRASAPFFATLFTLSTHDPYELPDDWQPRFETDGVFSQFAETVRFADAQLEKFYAWYEQHERPRGTLLLLTGDHSPRVRFPKDPDGTSTGEFEYRFRVPFIIAGLSPEERARGERNRAATSGHLDIAQTLLPLMGIDQQSCFQGRNLLGAVVPPQRVVTSTAGENLEFLYFQRGSERWLSRLQTGEYSLHDDSTDPHFQRDLFSPQHPGANWIRGITRDYMREGQYLNLGEHFAPPRPVAAKRQAISALYPPLWVSHRGNTRGPSTAEEENSLAAVREAKRRGFQWVEIDIGLTADAQVILQHDQVLNSPQGSDAEAATKNTEPTAEELVEQLTMQQLQKKLGRDVIPFRTLISAAEVPENLCVELKVPHYFLKRMDLVQHTLGVLRSLPTNRRVIIDSFNRTMLNFARKGISELQAAGEHRDWQLGYDLPQMPVEPGWLQFAADSSFDWVYIRENFVTEAIVKRAHELGLRVMAYPTNTAARAEVLIDWGVDGLMTDTAELLPAQHPQD